MFERFTADARAVVVGAQAHARRLGQRPIGTAHLLRALVDSAGTTSRALAAVGVTAATMDAALVTERADDRDTDRRALASIGIDLDVVLGAVAADLATTPPAPGVPSGRRRRHGIGRAWSRARRRPRGRATRSPSGHIPFSARSKRCLELALREALRLGSRRITTEHLLLGILREGHGQGRRILTDRGVSITALRHELERELRRSA